MVVKTPEQLEDAAIADAIRTLVALRTRAEQRRIQNAITEAVKERLDTARLQGKRLNVDKFVVEVAREVGLYEGR